MTGITNRPRALCRRIHDRRQDPRQGHPTVRTRHESDEVGAVLILAMIFLLVIGLIVGALASWTANDLSGTVVFQNVRSTEFALNSATQLAIQNIRYVPLISPNPALGTDETLNASPPGYCWGSGPGSEQPTTQGNTTLTVAVWCSTQWNPASSTTRVVTISACIIPSSVTIGISNWASLSSSCAANPGLQTEVSFDDYESNLSTTSPCTSTCGSGMTINGSSSDPTDPTVTSLSPSSGPVTGGTSLTITGSNFVSGSTTVYFVDPVPSDNVVLTVAPSSVTFNSATSISVTTPGVTTSENYYVVVSTPNGNSLDGPRFGYQPVIPTVSSITPTSGSANGGTAVTINGTGFLANGNGDLTTVTFTDTANSTITATAAYLSVNSSGTVITATTPSITIGTTYYVTVTTKPGGTSTQSASLEFTYEPFYPVADSITPTSGANGAVTVTGLGFSSGANATTVTLIPTGGGNGITLTNVSVSSTTSLTAQVPSGSNGTYYVSITTTWNGTQYQSCNSNGSGNVPSCSSEGAPTYQYT